MISLTPSDLVRGYVIAFVSFASTIALALRVAWWKAIACTLLGMFVAALLGLMLEAVQRRRRTP